MTEPSDTHLNANMYRLVQETFPADVWSGMTILVAVSGGADSVALLMALSDLRPQDSTIIVAHLDHEVRGQESTEDASFVQNLSQKMGVDCIAKKRSAFTDSKSTDEASLRAVRYHFLEQTANMVGARYLATAHHANDVAETFLINMIRGAGLKGLSSIPAYRPLNQSTKALGNWNRVPNHENNGIPLGIDSEVVLVRPLLLVTRKQIEDYLHSLDQPYRTDTSNHSHDYLRNEIRENLIPLIDQIGRQRFNRSFVESSIQLTAQLRETDAVIDALAVDANEMLTFDLNRSELDIPSAYFRNHAWPVAQRGLAVAFTEMDWSISKMTAVHWNQIREFAELADVRTEKTDPNAVAEKMLPNRLQLISTLSGILIREQKAAH